MFIKFVQYVFKKKEGVDFKSENIGMFKLPRLKHKSTPV